MSAEDDARRALLGPVAVAAAERLADQAPPPTPERIAFLIRILGLREPGSGHATKVNDQAGAHVDDGVP